MTTSPGSTPPAGSGRQPRWRRSFTRGPRRHHDPLRTAGAVFLIALAAAVLLVAGTYSWKHFVNDSAPAIAASTTPAKKASPDSTDQASAARSTNTAETAASCTTRTSLPNGFGSYQLPTVATDTAWWTNVAAYAQKEHVSLLAYGGINEPLGVIRTLASIIGHHCMATAVNVGSYYQAGGVNAVSSLVNGLKNTDVVGYVVNVDDVNAHLGVTQVSQVDSVVAAIHAADHASWVLVTGDMADFTSQANSFAYLSQFAGDIRSIAYYPFIGSATYGPVSALSIAGAVDQHLSGIHSIAITQGFNWWETDPSFAREMGFSHARLPSCSGAHCATGNMAGPSVGSMIRLQLRAGATNVMIVGLEPRSDDLTIVKADIACMMEALRNR